MTSVHVVFFGDQHLLSLGGAQVSMRLQRHFLERVGHTVTVVAPARTGRPPETDPAFVDMPSFPITPDREYSLTWPGRRTDAWVDRAMARRPAVDVVHVQADFWGAFIGHRFARRHGLPVVHTMHNRVDVGIRATLPFPGLAMRGFGLWQRSALGITPGARDGWQYLAGFAGLSDAVTAPSAHFARRLEKHGAVPASGGVDVVWNGIDDDLLDAALADSGVREPGPPRFVWLGRMSAEKRLLPFLEAVAEAGSDARVEVIGGGTQWRAAHRRAESLGLLDPENPVVTFAGRLPYAQTLRRMARADAVVQTSIGFETQGMTVFEAAAMGTPAVVSDPDIAAELESGFWPVAGESVAELADALRGAASDIASGAAVRPNPMIAETFRQSSRTAAMLEVYERVLR